jgi:hypothetical protein
MEAKITDAREEILTNAEKFIYQRGTDLLVENLRYSS